MQIEGIIKLGGSAVTRKDDLETEKLDEIRKFAEFLKLQKSDSISRRFILVHGAGSFGHFQAKQYGVVHGYHSNKGDTPNDPEEIKMGFCKTRLSVTKLNHLIVNELVNQGVKAVGVSPCSGWATDQGSIVQSDTASIQRLLTDGYQPVMHGDCVLDRHQGCTILSGDTVIEKLCSVFKPKRVIFLTDIDGVYDKPPSHPDAQLLPVVKVTQDGGLSVPVATTQQAHDVTGGILKKLSTAKSIVTESQGETTVFVCRINSAAAGNVIAQGELLGELGTEIKMQLREDG